MTNWSWKTSACIAHWPTCIAAPRSSRAPSADVLTGCGRKPLPAGNCPLPLSAAPCYCFSTGFHGRKNVRRILIAAAIGLFASAACAEDLEIALIYGKTGPLEAYAKQTETGLRMGFEYATKGTMAA